MKKSNETNVDIEILVKLKEQGKTDKEISKHLKEQGTQMSKVTVNQRLRRYYDSLRREKPKITRTRKKIDVDTQELVKLKKQKMTDKEIAEHMKYHDEIEEILMCGMTIEEFITQYEQQDNEVEIREKFKKLRVVAEYSKKENGETIQDREFIRVLDLLEGPKENMNKFNNINSYIVEGKLEKGKIDDIKDVIFHKNTDLMVYIFERLRMNLNKGYDERIFNQSRKSIKLR